jgi:hypothetical protein
MTKEKRKADEAALLTWLSTWRQYVENIVVNDDADLAEICHQDMLVKAHLPRLTKLVQDDAFIKLLAKSHDQLSKKVGEEPARSAVRRFLTTACWVCKPGFPATNDKAILKQDSGDLKRDWLYLYEASIKLAKQIERLSPALGPDSYTYLEARLQAGNPLGYIYKRKNSWPSALPQQPARRLSELLRCYASDIQEEAALLGIAMESRRQIGGAQADLHLALDEMARASILISAEVPSKPNFALVNSVIVALLDPPNGFDSSTARKRFMASKRRKTRA